MLTDLVLFRHAKAVRHDEAPTDRDRALTPRGRRDAAAAARRLAEAGFVPDAALVSPSVRTRQTWDCARSLLPDAPAAFPESLYLAEARDIQIAAADAAAARVLVIGHNPGLHDLAVALAEDGEPAELAALRDHLATSAIVWLTRAVPAGPFRLKAFFSRPGALD